MPSDPARMEVRLPAQSREVRDLEQLAEKVRNNATRRGEAATYIIQMWSRVLHDEISPATFWDLFGIQMPQLSPNTMSPYGVSAASMALTPAPAALPPDVSNVPADDPEAAKQKQKRERAKRNREAASWEP
jgi:hypothetical protein